MYDKPRDNSKYWADQLKDVENDLDATRPINIILKWVKIFVPSIMVSVILWFYQP